MTVADTIRALFDESRLLGEQWEQFTAAGDWEAADAVLTRIRQNTRAQVDLLATR